MFDRILSVAGFGDDQTYLIDTSKKKWSDGVKVAKSKSAADKRRMAKIDKLAAQGRDDEVWECPTKSSIEWSVPPSGWIMGTMARFSLGQLLGFVFASCVYLAAMRSLVLSLTLTIDSGNRIDLLNSWHSTLTQIGAWGVLAALYHRWRLTPAIVVHLAAFVVAFLLTLPGTGVPTWSTIPFIVVSGCALGTSGSFPTAIWMIFLRGLRAESPAK